MLFRQREFPGRKTDGIPIFHPTVASKLHWPVCDSKLTGMQQSIGNLQYNIAETCSQIA